MGWDFVKGATKQSIVGNILSEFSPSVQILGQALVGNNFWLTVKDPAFLRGEPVVLLYLLENDKGYGWGYKSLDETMHPYYYDCPLNLLMGLGTHNEQSIKWRAKVYEWHKQRKRK